MFPLRGPEGREEGLTMWEPTEFVYAAAVLPVVGWLETGRPGCRGPMGEGGLSLDDDLDDALARVI